MPQMEAAQQTEFLETPGILMRIAVVRPNGAPLVTPIWFIHRDATIYFTPREKSEWFACLRADPRVSLCIDEQPPPYRKVLIDGVAELVHDVGNDDAWRELYRDIALRYTPPSFADAYLNDTADEPRGLWSLDLDSADVATWRMPTGDGEDRLAVWAPKYYHDGR